MTSSWSSGNVTVWSEKTSEIAVLRNRWLINTLDATSTLQPSQHPKCEITELANLPSTGMKTVVDCFQTSHN